MSISPINAPPGLYAVQIITLDGSTLADVPVEAEFFTARTHAGHILRGYARKLDDFSLTCRLVDIDGAVLGTATVHKDATRARGPNRVKDRWGVKRERTPEDKAARRLAQPKINVVKWRAA